MSRKNTFGGLGDMPHPTITRVKTPTIKMAPSPKTLADVVIKMDALESDELDKTAVTNYELIWVQLRNWVEANSEYPSVAERTTAHVLAEPCGDPDCTRPDCQTTARP